MSKVQLRRPRRIFGGNNGSSAQPTGRPKSWGEFNQNFVTVSEIVSASNADLAEIKEDQPITEAPKQRTQSSSTILNGPAFRSVLPPTFADPRKKQADEAEDNVFKPMQNKPQPNNNVDDKYRNRITDHISPPPANNIINPESHIIFQDPVKKSVNTDVSSDESSDSAIAVSVASSNQHDSTRAIWSPESRGQRTSYDLESISTASNCDVTDTERIPVPVPTKDCYAELPTMSCDKSDSSSSSSDEQQECYDADQSTEDVHHAPMSLRARKQINKKNREADEIEPAKNIAHNTGTWPRRKKDKLEKSPEELMRQFRELSAEHMSKVRSIYSESRRKVDDLLLSLKLTMTKNGYNKDQRQRS